jgi:hypothetical protein
MRPPDDGIQMYRSQAPEESNAEGLSVHSVHSAQIIRGSSFSGHEGDLPGDSRFVARINSIYTKWSKDGHINELNKDEMAEAATAFAIHQYAQKYPLEIGAGPQYSKAVQAQTLFHECRRADVSNRADYRKHYKDHVHSSWYNQLGYSIKSYVRSNKANIFSTVGLIIALIILFYKIDSQVSDIQKNQLDPLSDKVTNMQTLTNQATAQVNGALSQMTSLQSGLSGFGDQLAIANSTIQLSLKNMNAQLEQGAVSINLLQDSLSRLNITEYLDKLYVLNQDFNLYSGRVNSSQLLVESLSASATLSSQLCTDASGAYLNISTNLLNTIKPALDLAVSSLNISLSQVQNETNRQKNMSIVLFALSPLQNSSDPNGVFFLPSVSVSSTLPFVPIFSYGKSVQCFSNYSCVLVGPGVFYLHISFATYPSPNGAGSFYFGWKDTAANGFLGTAGFAVADYSNEGTSSESFVSLSPSQSMMIVPVSLPSIYNSINAQIYASNPLATFNRAVIQQLR